MPRFIPAPAGNIGRCWKYTAAASVHPRACGEHSGSVSSYSADIGSSPRLRGTFGEPRIVVVVDRFIPAPAGNIQRIVLTRCTSTVHPRACGEHFPQASRPFAISGSSPRLRGTWLAGGLPARRCRFIPAPAGNMVGRRASSAALSVHPRACGEHEAHRLGVGEQYGSSPRLRGTCP